MIITGHRKGAAEDGIGARSAEISRKSGGVQSFAGSCVHTGELQSYCRDGYRCRNLEENGRGASFAGRCVYTAEMLNLQE
jgi:hypothetical protein